MDSAERTKWLEDQLWNGWLVDCYSTLLDPEKRYQITAPDGTEYSSDSLAGAIDLAESSCEA